MIWPSECTGLETSRHRNDREEEKAIHRYSELKNSDIGIGFKSSLIDQFPHINILAWLEA